MAKAFLDRVSNKAIGQLLIERGFLSSEQCDEALTEARRNGARLGETLLSMGLVSRDVLNYALGEQFGLQPVELHPAMVDPVLVRRFPIEFLHRHLMLPLIEIGNEIVVVVSDPNDTAGLKEFAGFVPSHQVSAQLADAEQVRRCLEAFEPAARHRNLYDATPVTTDLELQAMAARPSEENIVRWLVTAAIQYPDCDLVISSSGDKALITRRRIDGEPATEPVHEFDGNLFSTVRESLLAQCDAVTPGHGQFWMLNSPLRFAGQLYELQIAVYRHVGGDMIRLRPLAYPENEIATGSKPGTDNGQSPHPPDYHVILYTARGLLEEYLSDYFQRCSKPHEVQLLLQESTRRIYTQAVTYPGLFADLPALVMATRASTVIFDYPVSTDMILRVRSAEHPAPPVVVCAPAADNSNPDIVQLLNQLQPSVTLLEQGADPVVLTAEAAVQKLGGNA